MATQPPAPLIARRARHSDSLVLFEWRNDPHTREASANRDRVDWAEHSSWFERVLDDDHRRLYLIEMGQHVIGMCRFDTLADGSVAEVSINLAPAQRGMGLATGVLGAGIDEFARENPHVGLTARIRPANIASAKIFTALGFRRSGSDGEFEHFER